jgi:TatA/E family protein of Tat protein translocase
MVVDSGEPWIIGRFTRMFPVKLRCLPLPVGGSYHNDMNFGFSGEMIFLFLLALILFGPKKLPEIGRTIGRFMNEFRRASNEFRSQIESEINSLDSQSKPQQILPPFQSPLNSIASRIFNPPPPEKLRAEEAQSAVSPAPEPAESQVASAASENVVVENVLASAPAPSKVAPDA